MKTKLLIAAIIAGGLAGVLFGRCTILKAKYDEAIISRHELQAELIDTVFRLQEAKAKISELEEQLAEIEAAEPAFEYLGVFTVSAYCCEPYKHICGEGHGITASGLPVAPGIVAVDPEVIELGATIYICGEAYLAADTGAAIKGNRVDIAVLTHKEAVSYAVQTHDVYVIKGGFVSEY